MTLGHDIVYSYRPLSRYRACNWFS